jgi:hypothetical protein
MASLIQKVIFNSFGRHSIFEGSLLMWKGKVKIDKNRIPINLLENPIYKNSSTHKETSNGKLC